jgi:glycosyltransferase involved in cell wall biosynthesis
VSGVKLWVTVHDMIPYIFWDEMVKRVPRDFSYSLKLAWKRLAQADRIITDSEHSKQDICERLQVKSEKVDVVYLGVSEQLRPLEPTVAREKLKKLWNLEGPYLLYVGGSDYRKNLGALIGAFSRLRERGYTGKLVLVGETFLMDIPEARKIREEIQRVGLATEVLFPGFVEDENLSDLYSACDFFVFPSLYEGFGLPVLEAMKCGAPLLIGRTSSLPEVAGDCAHYFEPKEVESLIEVFWKAYGSPEAVEEKKRQGLQRAKSFTWQDAAQKVLELYSRHGI